MSGKVIFWVAILGSVAIPAFIAYKLKASPLVVVGSALALPAAGLVVVGGLRT